MTSAGPVARPAATAFTSRPYAGLDDLRVMTALVSDAWSARKPDVAVHPGDLEWWVSMHEKPAGEWEGRIRLWFDVHRRPVAWGFHDPPDSLDWFLAHDLRQEERETLRAQMLRWLEERADAADSAGTAVSRLEVWAMESDAAAVRSLERAGFTVGSDTLRMHLLPLDADLPDPSPPDGFVLRSSRGEDDVAGRTAAHQAAFAPSRVTEDSYRQVMAADHYRSEMDFLAVAPDGRVAAFCLLWLDAENRTVLYEPVGTHPDFQRLGLGRAICLFAAHRAREAGADLAIVNSWGAYEGPDRLYGSVGFREHTRHRQFLRPRHAPASANDTGPEGEG
jgi:GNAT superfamily N-acetyltransferase